MGITTDDIALGGAFGTEGTTDGGSLGGSFGGDESPLTQSATNEAVTSADAAKASAAAAAASAAAAAQSEANAETDADNASNSETAAALSAASAATSATQSATSATNSATSATSSANSATASAASATQSSGYADDAAASAAAALVSENNASASETASAASESAAATSATTATTQATNAATSASQAATSASASASSATDSANSATASASSATAASNSAASAAVSETNAAASATAAGTSEDNAATSETNAAASATAAATSATAASASETNAATSETNASTSESNAATSATNSANSAVASATSASEAASSAASAASDASSAAAQASAAATSASNASTSETNAATSETNAAASEANAATSATNSANSATASATSATASAASASTAQAASDAALAALDSFDDRYLGVKSADPTVDNDGNPLVTGALYYNDVDDAMKVYEGSVWVAAYASLSGALLVNNNLDDLQDAATARTNLGLGTAATTDSTAYATAAQGALADTALQSYTETDPIFSASEAASITNTNTTNWNTAYGWGDHSVEGYAVEDTAVSFTTLQLDGMPSPMAWNSTDGTVDIPLSTDVTLQVGQEEVIYCKAGEALADGDVVYASGAVGASDAIEVSKYIANNTIDEIYVLGVATQALSVGEFGYITTFGKVRGISTDGSSVGETWVDGTVLYASASTAGALTSTKPSSPNQAISVAMVINAHASNGTLFTRPTAGFHLNELHNVSETAPNDGQLLTWNASSSVWEAADAPVSLPDQTGNTGLYLTTDGSNASWAEVTGGIAYTRHTANYTASTQEGIIADTSGGSFTVTLPATPATGDVVVISDGSNFFNNNLTVGRNGSTIEGTAEDMTVDVAGVSVTFLYDGSTWQVYAQAGTLQTDTASYNKQTYVATSGQTEFTGLDYSIGYADVYLNGVKLVEGDDYTALSGTSITLTTGATAGADVEVISYKAVPISDVYTKSQSDVRYYTQTQIDTTLTNYYTSTQVDAAIAANPSAYSLWSVKTANYTAVTADQLACSGTFTVTLPASPSAGDTVIISNVGAGVITVGRNGSNINSAAEDGTLNADTSAQLVYIDGTIGWKEI